MCEYYLSLTISFLRHGMQHDWKDTIFVVHVSPGSAETLVRRGGIANNIFDSVLSQQQLYQKIIKIGRCALSVRHQCRFLRHNVLLSDECQLWWLTSIAADTVTVIAYILTWRAYVLWIIIRMSYRWLDRITRLLLLVGGFGTCCPSNHPLVDNYEHSKRL